MIFNKKYSNNQVTDACSKMYGHMEQDMKNGKGSNGAAMAAYMGGEATGVFPVAIFMMSGLTEEMFREINDIVKEKLDVKDSTNIKVGGGTQIIDNN